MLYIYLYPRLSKKYICIYVLNCLLEYLNSSIGWACLLDKKSNKWAKSIYLTKNWINENKAYLLKDKLGYRLADLLDNLSNK